MYHMLTLVNVLTNNEQVTLIFVNVC